MHTTTRRLFIAVRPPSAVAARIRDQAVSVLDASEWRVYGAGDVHLTLCFLGATSADLIPPLLSALEREITPLRAADVVIAGTGAFPSASKARVLWAGVRAPREDLEHLRLLERAAFRAARAAGLEPDESSSGERFQPHVTLARPRTGRRTSIPERFRKLAFEEIWHVDEVHLFESLGGGSGFERYPSLGVFRCGATTS
jgi:RNA 2',3'-cyclic 3'-phosphodiesterase